jgi:hypothetical protein
LPVPTNARRVALVLSVAFHCALLEGWLTEPLASLFPPRVTWNDVDGEVTLPTEVLLLEPEAPSSGAKGEDEKPLAAGEGLDGGTRDGGDDAGLTDGGPDGGADGGEPADADAGPAAPAAASSNGRRPAPPAEPAPRPVASAGPETTKPKDPARLRDPLVLSGKAGSLAGKDPNVSAMVLPESFRAHPSSKRLGALLSKVPQWKAFLEATSLDPIADVDRLLIAGPQLRQSAKVAVVIKTRWTDAKLRAALERLREKAGGEWDAAPTPPVLKTTLDGAERFVVMLGGGLLVIVPIEALPQAKAMRGGSFPAARGAAFLFTLKQPGKALSGLPFAVPTTLEAVRLTMTMRADGGADVAFEGTTGSAAASVIAADVLTRGLETATTRKTFLGTIRLFDPVTFVADGTRVRATMSLHGGQLAQVIEIVGEPIEVSSAP